MLTDPFPKSPLGAQLCNIFQYRWMSLEGDTDEPSAPNWRTISNYPLRPRSLWQKWQDAKALVGVRFGAQTQYALIDIDRGSSLFNKDSLQAVRDALETIGLCRSILIRSSWSGGLHLYFPLPEPVKTFDLACAIRYALEANELFIEPGQLEVFPNTKAFSRGRLGQFSEYNGHRLPLQPGSGSCLLSDDMQAMGSDLQTFFNNWKFCTQAQDIDALSEALECGRDLHRKRPKLRSHPLDTWRDEWELEINEGWTDHGQTNSLLKVISGYGRVFLRLEGEELHEFVVETAIHAPGFEDYCGHQYDIGRKAAAWCLSAERYYWPLGSEAKREQAAYDLNLERAQDAQSRIQAAYEWLTKHSHWPSTVTAQLKALSQKAHTSFKTLYKYSHIWKPSERCVIDHTPDVSADSPPPPPPPPQNLKPLPRGVLHTLSQFTKGVALKDAQKSVIPGKGIGVRGKGKGFPQAEPL